MIIQNDNLYLISKVKEQCTHIDINVVLEFTIAKKYDKNDMTSYNHCVPYHYNYINNKISIEFPEFCEQITCAGKNTPNNTKIAFCGCNKDFLSYYKNNETFFNDHGIFIDYINVYDSNYDFLKIIEYKYILYAPEDDDDDLLRLLLYSNRPIFVIEKQYQVFYYKDLTPSKHYISIENYNDIINNYVSLEKNQDLCTNITNVAYTFAINTFSIELFIKKINDVYNKIPIEIKYKHILNESTNEKKICISFDDGPTHNTNKLLNILKSYDIKCTFFVLGENIHNNMETFRKMHECGHSIQIHGWNHENIFYMEMDNMINDIENTKNIIFSITGIMPMYYRPPYGEIGLAKQQAIQDICKLKINMGNVFSHDTECRNEESIIRNVTNEVKNRSIVVFHDHVDETINAMDSIIKNLIENEFKFVNINDL